MELTEMDKGELKQALRANHTRSGRISEIMQAVGRKQLRVGQDGALTVLVCGDSVGVAKRAESGPKRDEPNELVGLCIAASRL